MDNIRFKFNIQKTIELFLQDNLKHLPMLEHIEQKDFSETSFRHLVVLIRLMLTVDFTMTICRNDQPFHRA